MLFVLTPICVEPLNEDSNFIISAIIIHFAYRIIQHIGGITYFLMYYHAGHIVFTTDALHPFRREICGEAIREAKGNGVVFGFSALLKADALILRVYVYDFIE